MKKILFPTDFSLAANNAFVYALRLAKKTGASITTVHAYEMPYLESTHLPVTIQEVYDSINLEEFENYRDSIPRLRQIAEQQGLGDVNVNHTLVEGESVKSIIRSAKKEEADLIVMGTTGATGLKKVFLGSVAAEVMENGPCPVLAVPEKAVFDGIIDRLAFTTEFKAEEKKALNWLANWTAPFDADIYCINVDLSHTEKYARRMEEMKVTFLDRKNIYFEVLDGTNFEAEVSKFLKEMKIDMLAMVIHKRDFLKELFSYSMTKKLAYHLETPILAIQSAMVGKTSKTYQPPIIV